MRKFAFAALIIFFVPFIYRAAAAEPRAGYSEAASVTVGGMTLTSFTDCWDERALHELHGELLENFCGGELEYLSAIYLYPGAPDGVFGNYYEDIRYLPDGTLYFGNGAYIELFRADLCDIAGIAPILSHEYGHHYTIYNITEYEGKIYSEWDATEYAELRGMNGYPVSFAYTGGDGYSRLWDVTEIAASDYTQLFGSERAKAGESFEVRPQENLDLPLAANVEGLFGYLLNAGGYTGFEFYTPEQPRIVGVSVEGDRVRVSWNGSGDYIFYNLVIYPEGEPLFAESAGTVYPGGDLSAVFDAGSLAGDYTLLVLAYDEYGWVYASEPFGYAFDYCCGDIVSYAPAAAEKPAALHPVAVINSNNFEPVKRQRKI